jgi:hypothetical protein
MILMALGCVVLPATNAGELNPPAPAGPATRLQPERSAAGDGFGQAIAVDADTAVIGAPQADQGRGAVAVFERYGHEWREAARLTAGDAAVGDDFGRAVAICGDTILVGASGHARAGFLAGAVYVFERVSGRWPQVAKLLPTSAQDARFGWSVALSGDTAVIGAPHSRQQGEILHVGSATLFERRGREWSPKTRLATGLGGGPLSSDLFGWSVAAAPQVVAVGARLQGAVYVYELSGGQWRRTATVRDQTGGNQFGFSVALAGNRLLVGAPAANRPAPRTGTAVLYARRSDGGWVETARLAADGLRPGSRFGSSVALQRELAAVGMHENDGRDDVEKSGGTVAFRIAEGPAADGERLFAAQPEPYAHLGTAVAISGNLVLAGAPGHRKAPGVVYAFDLREPTAP